MYQIDIVGQSDIGLVRPNNEDAFFIDPNVGFCLVADGMGGAAAGETASRIFTESAVGLLCVGLSSSHDEVADQVQKVFLFANKQILQHTLQHPQNRGMGCTAELFAMSSKGFVIGHIGDSRSYRWRKGMLAQLTKDHSLVQDQLDKGLITRRQARVHPMRNVISRAIGVRETPIVDIVRGPVLPGDLFLLCSDGLTDMVEDSTIAGSLSESGSLEIKVGHLIDLALKAGGKDNITAVLAQIT